MANTFGYGAMTNSLGDMQKSRAIIIFGANPAVNHPVGFQHILKAKERNNAQLIVIDPRFTKTAAKADLYAQIRPGTDIPFMYGMLNIIFANGWEDKEYTDARVFGMDKIREEAKKWTPELVADVTGVPAEKLIQITNIYAKNRPGSLIWAMGLTQHSIGTSNTRMAPILQLALGNMGKAGGGTNILRGHDNVQGATDMGCLSDSLPGYYGLAAGSWKYFARMWGVEYDYLVKQFKAPEWMEKNGFSLSRWWAGVQNVKSDEKIENAGTPLKAVIVMGCGITSIAQQAKVKEGLDNLDLLVLADPFVNEAAILTDKKDNVFLLPSATQFENSGYTVATNRSAQWRYKVIEPMYESKSDHDVMFALAKHLGFYEQYTKALTMQINPKTGALEPVPGKTTFQWPEDATDEIARTIRTIGLMGWTADRIKKHTDNWHMFDEVTGAGQGPMKGEYYGLPWPCWTKTHGGSPNLYDTSISVKEGGMGFRNNFGLEKDGVNLLAEKGSSPKDSKLQEGYAEVTKENVEKLIGRTLTEEEKTACGANWKVCTTGKLVELVLEAGLSPYGNAKARAVVWNFPDQIPMHREPLHSPRQDLVAKYPTFADKANHFRVMTKFASIQGAKDYSKEFPINMITARLVTMNGAGIENRASKYIAALTPEMFCNVHPDLAHKHGIKNGDMMWVHSPEGTKIKVKAKYSLSVLPDMVFMPFHFAGYFQGTDRTGNFPEGTKPYASGESVNTVTNYGYDIITQIPETKGGLCRIEKA